MNTLVLPQLIIVEILMVIIDSPQYPYRYKLSLGLISKWVFSKLGHHSFNSLICTLDKNKKGHLDLNKKGELEKHLDKKTCIIKSIDRITLSFPYDTLPLKLDRLHSRVIVIHRYGQIQSLTLTSLSMEISKDLFRFLSWFPNLKYLNVNLLGCTVDMVKIETITIPQLESLYLYGVNQITLITTLLTLLQSSLTLIVLDLDIYQNIEQLDEFLITYKAPNLRHFNIFHKFVFSGVKSLIENHKDTLQSVVYPTGIGNQVVELFEQLKYLQQTVVYFSSYSQLVRLFKFINQKPLFRKLTLYIFGQIKDKIDQISEDDLPDFRLTHLKSFIFPTNFPKPLFQSIMKYNSNSTTLTSLHIADIPDHESFLQFLKTNKSLVHLHFQPLFDSISKELQHSLSLLISKIPTLVTLSLLCVSRIRNISDIVIFQHLHESQSLNFIMFTSQFLSDDHQQTLESIAPRPPFEYVPLSPLVFIRNGIHYDQNHKKKHSINFFKLLV
ncbi:hypothetical protein DLAC_00855 [Tieghemostelium lacteum]|uniref:Uncharacterized protein n=1 Tax=Tieghemostelium lacteum TaxID=361077 RepID=A0A152A780_TIELA|nr:hypothetical protein DLAC_00855 [Tieghemostelium lacteum]|eukprot:KYR02056.1 hypothetical protein DLAC_00855 [Tieghemostelium lacteum]